MIGLIVIFLSVTCIVIHIKNFMKKSDEREFGLLRHILGFIGCLIALAIGLAMFFLGSIKSPIHIAAIEGNTETVKQLLADGRMWMREMWTAEPLCT